MAFDDGYAKALNDLLAATAVKKRLREELAAIRDLAYRGVGDPSSALEAIHKRAVRALDEED